MPIFCRQIKKCVKDQRELLGGVVGDDALIVPYAVVGWGVRDDEGIVPYGIKYSEPERFRTVPYEYRRCSAGLVKQNTKEDGA